MPLDPNIILSGKAPEIQNPLDAMSKAMAFRSLVSRSQTEDLQARQAQQEFSDNQALRTAMNNNTSIDPNGNYNVDRQGVFKSLAQSNPSLVPKVAQQFAATDMEMQKQHLATMRGKMEMTGQLLGGVTDQKSYDNALSQIKSMNGDISQLPPQYDPGAVHSAQMWAMNAKDQVEAQAKQQGLDIEKTKADNENQKVKLEMFKTFGAGGSGGGVKGAPVDPSTLVVNRLPPHLQPKALEEIKDNQNIAKIAGPALEAFDRAAKDARPMTGKFSDTSPAALVPSVPYLMDKPETAGQKAFMGLVNTTIKETEGTARQAAFDSVKKNFMPQTGDSDATVASKKAAFVQYLQSHTAAPTNMSKGIDLSKFPSTSIDPKLIEKHTQENTKVSHKDMPIGSESNGMVKTAKGWIPKGADLNATK